MMQTTLELSSVEEKPPVLPPHSQQLLNEGRTTHARMSPKTVPNSIFHADRLAPIDRSGGFALSLKRTLAVAAVAILMVPIVACEDVTKPPPPEPDPQIHITRHFTKTTDAKGNQTGLQSNDVYTLHVAQNGALWIGNQAGVAVYNDPTSTIRDAAYDQNNGLPNPKVRAVVELDGKAYVGTWGGGLGVFDGAAWTTLRTSDGLVNDLVSDMKVDDGKLYIATTGGVSSYNPATNNWARFTRNPADSVVGDLLDAYVSAMEIANTPRGKEFWYAPRWESTVEESRRNQHGLTTTRGSFNASPDTVRLQASKDNTLFELADTLSNGAGTKFFVGTASGYRNRGVLEFDVASAGIPSDAIIVKATLRASVITGSVVAANNVRLYRALTEWGEGTSLAGGDESGGAPATAGDATWKYAMYPDVLWNEPGGDYAASASGSVMIDSPKRYEWSTPAMAGDITAWLRDPSSNHGWVMVGGNARKFMASRTYPVVGSRPQLEIIYARYFYTTLASSALPEADVNDIYYDEPTNLFWLAMATRGIATIDVDNAVWTFYTTDDGLPSNVVYSIAKANGQMWFGTQNGVARYLSNGTFRGYDRGGGLPADRVRFTYTDDGQRLWLGFVEAGAALVDPKSAQ